MHPIAEEGRNLTGPCKKMCDPSVRGLVVTYNGPYSLVVTYSGPYTRRYFRLSALSLGIGQA